MSVDAYQAKSAAYTAAIAPGLGALGCSFQASDAGALINLLGKIFAQGTALMFLDTVAGTLNGGGAGVEVVGTGVTAPAGLAEGFSDGMDWLVKTWLSIVIWGLVATVAVIAGSGLIQSGLDLNSNFLTANNAVVATGHGIILTVANVGFVIALVIMGIMVILRRKEWDIGKILPRFIAAVALVNFGLFISSVLIDISSTVMKGFLGDQCMGWFLYHAFSMPNLNEAFSQSGLLAGLVGEPTSVFGVLLGLLSLVLATIFSVIGALTVFTIVVFLLLRYVVVSVLLVFMPLAWLGFAVPKLTIPSFGNPWGYWWKQFTQWLIFGPLIAFFLYLGSLLSASIGEIATTANPPYPLVGLIQTLIVIIISAGGLFIASKMSGVGGKLITAGVGMLAGGAIAGMRKLGGTAFRGQLSAQEKLKDKNLTDAERSKLRFQAAAFKGIGGASTSKLGWASKGLGAAGVKIREQKPLTAETFTEENIKKAEEQYKNLSNEEAASRLDRLNKTPSLGIEKRMALMKKLQKSGKLGLVKDVDGALALKNRFESVGTKFKDFELGLGTTAEIRAAEKNYLRTQESGIRNIASAKEEANAAEANLKIAAARKVTEYSSRENTMNLRKDDLDKAKDPSKIGWNDADLSTIQAKASTSQTKLNQEKEAYNKTVTGAAYANQKVTNAKDAKADADRSVEKATENLKIAEAEKAKAGTIFRNTENLANDISIDPIIRNNAKAELGNMEAEKNRRVDEALKAGLAKRAAEDTLKKSEKDIVAAEKEKVQAESKKTMAKDSLDQAETEFNRDQAEAEIAKKNNDDHKVAKQEYEEAAEAFKKLDDDVKEAQSAKDDADKNVAFTEASANSANTKALNDISDKTSAWAGKMGKDDLKKVPLDTMMSKFDPDKSPMDTKEGFEALQEAFIAENLKSVPISGKNKGGAGLNNLLNVKSENFEAASDAVYRKAAKDKLSAETTLSGTPNAAETAKATAERERMTRVISSINQQRANRGLLPL